MPVWPTCRLTSAAREAEESSTALEGHLGTDCLSRKCSEGQLHGASRRVVRGARAGARAGGGTAFLGGRICAFGEMQEL